ncbi:MAG: BAX inhibitor (BI)-1/YccA family protein, partial [Gallionellaceae bacterium]
MQYQTATPIGTIATEQNKVLRNTYMMLALTMIPTVIGAFIGMSVNFSFMAASPIMSSLLMFGA